MASLSMCCVAPGCGLSRGWILGGHLSSAQDSNFGDHTVCCFGVVHCQFCRYFLQCPFVMLPLMLHIRSNLSVRVGKVVLAYSVQVAFKSNPNDILFQNEVENIHQRLLRQSRQVSAESQCYLPGVKSSCKIHDNSLQMFQVNDLGIPRTSKRQQSLNDDNEEPIQRSASSACSRWKPGL